MAELHRTLVVAKYQEDVSWAKVAGDVVIIEKGKDMENIGREAGSYLHYIIKYYDVLNGVYAFSQGNPLDHCPYYLTELWEVGGHGTLRRSDPLGRPDHPTELPIERFWNELFDEPCPEQLNFYAGAQYTTTAETLTKREKDWYKKAFELSCEEDGPWAMERLWGYIF